MIKTKKKTVNGFENVTMEHLYSVNGGLGSGVIRLRDGRYTAPNAGFTDTEGYFCSSTYMTVSTRGKGFDPIFTIYYDHYAFDCMVTQDEIERFNHCKRGEWILQSFPVQKLSTKGAGELGIELS